MSYCRFSSDNFNCDLYIYEDVSGGFTTHVASNRQRTWIKLFYWITDKRLKFGNYKTRWRRFRLFKIPLFLTHKKIDGAFDGKTFNDDTISDVLKKVDALKRCGYKIPECSYNTIKEECESLIPKCSVCGCTGNHSCNNKVKSTSCELDQCLVCPCCKNKEKK
jgi:hypothetical protein